MANPQLEEGFTRIANELYRALYQIDLNGSELRIALFIIYQTYGYNQKSRKLAIEYISSGTGIPSETVKRSLNKLIKRNIVCAAAEHHNSIKELSINKDYTEWDRVKNDLSEGSKMTCQKLHDTKMTGQNRPDNGVKNDLSEGSKMTPKTRQNKTRHIKQDRESMPALADVKKYCFEKGYHFSPEKFFNYYAAIGWKQRGSDIVDWQKKADNWEATEISPKPEGGYQATYDISEYENTSIIDKEK